MARAGKKTGIAHKKPPEKTKAKVEETKAEKAKALEAAGRITPGDGPAAQPVETPIVKPGAYGDGHPLDDVHYIECKIILKPERFQEVENFRDFRARFSTWDGWTSARACSPRPTWRCGGGRLRAPAPDENQPRLPDPLWRGRGLAGASGRRSPRPEGNDQESGGSAI